MWYVSIKFDTNEQVSDPKLYNPKIMKSHGLPPTAKGPSNLLGVNNNNNKALTKPQSGATNGIKGPSNPR